MRGHIPVSLAVPGTLCGYPASKGWQGGDGRKGSVRASYRLICGEGGAVIKMPGLKAISSPGTTSLWRAASYTVGHVFKPPALHYKAAVLLERGWCSHKPCGKWNDFRWRCQCLKLYEQTILLFPSHYECVNMDKPKVPLYSKCLFWDISTPSND